MELIIVICLLIIIVLLVKEKIIIKKVVKGDQQRPVNRPSPEIMGKPKPINRQVVPNVETKHQLRKPNAQQAHPATETQERIYSKELPPEEPNDVFDEGPDLEEEEEDLKESGCLHDDDGFATGVTFEELGAVNKVLEQKASVLTKEREVVVILQKMQGTELYHLLENSMEGASKEIAALLDRHLPAGHSPSSAMHRDELDGFNISEFA